MFIEIRLARRRRPAVERLARLLERWAARAAQRRRLADLPDVRLRDLGLSRAAAQEEAGKPFWRA